MATAIEPGVYSSVDPEQLLKLRQQHGAMLEDNHVSAIQWISNRTEYIKVKERLSTLADKPKQEAMIPVGKKAFMRGTLLHTNEVCIFFKSFRPSLLLYI
jgi:prefoldin subunit 5